jgi:shikimate kinase
MGLFHDEALLPIIQLAITPVILMTALGSLLLTMTNRMGRIVDRTRSLAGLVHLAAGAERRHLEAQLRVLYRRAAWIRTAVTLNTASLLCSGLLVVVIFLAAVLETQLATIILVLFILSVGCMVAGLGAFLRDIFMSLTALELEVNRALREAPPAA